MVNCINLTDHYQLDMNKIITKKEGENIFIIMENESETIK